MATKKDDALTREGAGNWRTKDGRFLVRGESGGHWYLVDDSRRDAFGLELVSGPYATVAAAREAIARARTDFPEGSAAPHSPKAGEASATERGAAAAATHGAAHTTHGTTDPRTLDAAVTKPGAAATAPGRPRPVGASPAQPTATGHDEARSEGPAPSSRTIRRRQSPRDDHAATPALDGADVAARPRMEFGAVDASGNAAAHAAYLERMARRVAPIRAAAAERLGLHRGLRVLDAGCGLGEVALEIATLVAPGGSVAGIDLSEELIGRARRAAGEAHAGVEFTVGTLTALPYADASFDAVRSERVFQHLDADERLAAMRELVRVCRPGGVIQLIDPDHEQHAVAAADLDAAGALLRWARSRSRTARAGLLNPGLLVEAGLAAVTVDLHPIRFDALGDWFEALALDGALEAIVGDGTIAADRAAAFWRDLAARDAAGTFLGTGLSYVATGCVPGGADPAR